MWRSMRSKRFPGVETGAPPRAARKSPALFAGNPLPMWIYDVTSLRFLEVNESAERQYGYSRAEFLSLTLASIRPPPEEGTEATMQNGVTDQDTIHIRKDGTSM